MFDTLITGGTVVDGTGASPRRADIAIANGLIVDVAEHIEAAAAETIDASGAIVTPGWIDIHTHYDGQAAWDDQLAPSSMNGVTTAIMGNCGVGFAPVAPDSERLLVELMEGVEDIPGAALYEGVPWGEWESFPEYLDFLGGRSYAMDIGAQIPHGALRFYVMGTSERANDNATPDEVATQARLVAEAFEAGAVGFTTSRTIGHQTLWGDPVPGTFAPDDELLTIAAAIRDVGGGVIEAIPASTIGPLDHLGGERSSLLEEVNLLDRLSRASHGPVTFTLVQSRHDPDEWRTVLDDVDAANSNGARLVPQIPARPISVLTGLSSYHAFMRKPTYLERLAPLPLAERAEAMRSSDIRELLMTEESVPPAEPGSMDNLYRLLTQAAPSLIPIDDAVEYFSSSETSFGAVAKRSGTDPIDEMYDFLIGAGGSRFARLGREDAAGTEQAIFEMLQHQATATGLSDAGAHVTMICDGTMPTTQLIHWVRDRTAGPTIPVEQVVHKQTLRNAELYSLSDRGALRPGLRADINVIDLERLRVDAPVAHHDLPAGGTRLIQPVAGYRATLCNGVVTRLDDADTGARPGRLVRSRS